MWTFEIKRLTYFELSFHFTGYFRELTCFGINIYSRTLLIICFSACRRRRRRRRQYVFTMAEAVGFS